MSQFVLKNHATATLHVHAFALNAGLQDDINTQSSTSNFVQIGSAAVSDP